MVKLPRYRHILHSLRPKILARNNDKRCEHKDRKPKTLVNQQDDEMCKNLPQRSNRLTAPY
jgi:hypothetical protein